METPRRFLIKNEYSPPQKKLQHPQVMNTKRSFSGRCVSPRFLAHKSTSKRRHIDIMCVNPMSIWRLIDAYDVNMKSFWPRFDSSATQINIKTKSYWHHVRHVFCEFLFLFFMHMHVFVRLIQNIYSESRWVVEQLSWCSPLKISDPWVMKTLLYTLVMHCTLVFC